MRSKKFAISEMLLLLVAMLALGVFGTGAVWAYHANFVLNVNTSFELAERTVVCQGQNIFSTIENVEVNTSNFVVRPVAANSLEVTCKYSQFSNKQIVLSVNSGSLTLDKLIAYNVEVYDLENSADKYSNQFVAVDASGATLTVTLKAGVTPVSTDVIVLTILVN